MAAATPTVGFATGGIPEMLVHNQSGYLVPPGEIDGLVQGLQRGLLEGRISDWGRQARQRVEQHYTHDIFLANHLKLYEQAIADFNR